jgi:GT2 family glycosyltransferase
MIDGMKVGCGIITRNRPQQLLRLYRSLPLHCLDTLIIVNDGDPHPQFSSLDAAVVVHNPANLGVAKSKNLALAHCRDHGSEHVFLIEDDIHVKDPGVFGHYIDTALRTGIQHLNFSQHGLMNRTSDGRPAARAHVDYSPTLKLPFYLHCVGAFSYYSRQCLDAVGPMDEGFFNAFEHVDHTLAVIRAGMHPPFLFFADAPRSWEYLGDEPWSTSQSLISSRTDHAGLVARASERFRLKHGVLPGEVPDTSRDQVLQCLQMIQHKYARNR